MQREMGTGKQSVTVSRFLPGVLLATANLLLTGCSATGSVARFHSYYTDIQRVTSDGCVVLESGERIRLAGIRMRSVEETQEPELVDVVSNLVRLQSGRVRVVEDRTTETAVVYYRQGIHYLPHHVIPFTMAMRFIHPTTSATVNELLIIMAAARYDLSVGNLSDEAGRACMQAAKRADGALWGSRTYRPLQKYKYGGGVYVNNTGFCPRIAQGDIAQRDRYLLECREKTLALGRLDVPEGQDSIPTPTIDDVPKLVAALADDSRCVRRFAVNALGKLGPAGLGTPAVAALIKALTDEDEWVRAFAARALGEIGAPEATAALTKATSDDSEAVRKAATGALRKLRGS